MSRWWYNCFCLSKTVARNYLRPKGTGALTLTHMHTLQRAIQCRAFRPSYKQPQRTDILRCISVSVFNTARLTKELFTITLTYLLTATACFRSVGRRNKVNRYSFSFSFVAYVALKLMERPAIMQTSLRSAKLFVRRATDALQVLNSNRFAFAFSFDYNLLSNGMILNLYRRSFSPAKPFKNLFGSFCAFGLQRTTHFLSMRAKAIQFFARKWFSIVGTGNISNTQIYPYHIVKICFRFVWDIAGLQQVKFPFYIRQIRFPLRVFKQACMVFTRQVGNLLSAFYRPNRSNSFLKFIGKNPAVVSDSPQWPELPLTLSIARRTVQLAVRRAVGVGYFANASYHYLSRKARRSFDVMVGAVMDFVLTKAGPPGGFIFPSPSRNTITRRVRLLHGLQEQFCLFGSRLKMDFGCKFHTTNILTCLPVGKDSFHTLKPLFYLECVIAQGAYVFLPRLNRAAGRRGGILHISS